MTEASDDVDVIIDHALAATDDDEYWAAVVQLHRSAGRPTLDRLLSLLGSEEAEKRQLAANALGQFAARPDRDPAERRPFSHEIVDALIAAAARERDADVIGALAVAFGHQADDRAVPFLAAWGSHDDPDVRRDVTFGLCGLDSDLAVETFLHLMQDESSGVRDWATFGLGVQTDRDSPAIRDALLARLEDDDDQTRAEALHGLARRGETRAIPALLAAADEGPDEDWGTIHDAVVEMAITTRDPCLALPLRLIRNGWLLTSPDEPMYGTLLEALAAYDLPLELPTLDDEWFERESRPLRLRAIGAARAALDGLPGIEVVGDPDGPLRAPAYEVKDADGQTLALVQIHAYSAAVVAYENGRDKLHLLHQLGEDEILAEITRLVVDAATRGDDR